MKAVPLTAPEPMAEIRDVPVPEPGPGQVRIPDASPSERHLAPPADALPGYAELTAGRVRGRAVLVAGG
jgi:hypothetical protein